MKINIITVGKPHDANFKQAIYEYQKRISHYKSVEWIYIPTSNIVSESLAIEKRISAGYNILLDESGKLQTNNDFANQIETLQNTSYKQLNFIIGGPFGVSNKLKNSVDFVWSLSPLVFPHQLVRLILIEQIYRVYDILSGGNYHHN